MTVAIHGRVSAGSGEWRCRKCHQRMVITYTGELEFEPPNIARYWCYECLHEHREKAADFREELGASVGVVLGWRQVDAHRVILERADELIQVEERFKEIVRALQGPTPIIGPIGVDDLDRLLSRIKELQATEDLYNFAVTEGIQPKWIMKGNIK